MMPPSETGVNYLNAGTAIVTYTNN
jgi:hypothetical protein